jgi:uncharacterized protein YndB with AHSA1/START domain
MTTTSTTTDSIEKQVVLRAPRTRVWRALTQTQEFNEWFGVELQGSFAKGARLRGGIRHPGYQHLTMEITIDQFEPEHTLAWRWHPGAAEDSVAKKESETTLVVFTLEEVADGTLLKVVETGFDRVPVARRSLVFRQNEDGWTGQMKAIKKYVDEAK